MLCTIFFKALRDEYHTARDMMLMSHLQVGHPCVARLRVGTYTKSLIFSLASIHAVAWLTVSSKKQSLRISRQA